LCSTPAGLVIGGIHAGDRRLPFGRPDALEQKRGLVKDVTAAVVNNLGAPAESVTVSLVETPKTAKGKGGVLFSDMAPR